MAHTVTTIGVGSVTTSSCAWVMQLIDDGTLSNNDFQIYANGTGITDGTFPVDSGSGTQFSVDITGLTRGTYYALDLQYVAVSYCTSSVTTMDVPSTPTAPSLYSTDTQNSTYSITWSSVSGATGYRIIWHDEGTYYTPVDVGNITGPSTVTAYRNQLMGYAIQAYNVWGDSITGPDLAPSPIGSLPSTPSLSLSSTDGQNATYTLSYTLGANTDYIIIYWSGGNTAHLTSSSTITIPVSRNTTYNFYANGYNSNGYGSNSSTVTPSQIGSLPDAPSCYVSNVDTSTPKYDIAWGSTTGATSYTIHWYNDASESGTVYCGSNLYGSVAVTRNLLYTIWVVATNFTGYGPDSNILTPDPITAETPTITFPASDNTVGVTTSPTFAWNAVSADDYKWWCSDGTSGITAGTSVAKSGLSQNTGYTFSVCARIGGIEGLVAMRVFITSLAADNSHTYALSKLGIARDNHGVPVSLGSGNAMRNYRISSMRINGSPNISSYSTIAYSLTMLGSSSISAIQNSLRGNVTWSCSGGTLSYKTNSGSYAYFTSSGNYLLTSTSNDTYNPIRNATFYIHVI